MEYAGPVVRALSQEARFSVCNLAVEMASPTGMVSPDDTTFEYLAGREFAPSARYWEQALAFWRTLATDDDAVFDREETIDMTGVEPQVTWGINPEHAIGIGERIPDPDLAPAGKRATYRQAIEYSRLTPGEPILGTPVDEVFIGSCVESRISDLRAAAAVVEGRRVASTIASAWVVPGSNAVKAQAEAEGPRPHLHGRGIRVARVGVLEVLRVERRLRRAPGTGASPTQTATTSAARDGRPTPSWPARPPSPPRPSPAASPTCARSCRRPRRGTAPTPGGLVGRQAEPSGDDWRARSRRGNGADAWRVSWAPGGGRSATLRSRSATIGGQDARLATERTRSMAQEIRRGGHAFDVHEGLAAPFMFDNVSTDVIAPALTNLTEGLDAPRGGLGSNRGATAFANIRYNADGSAEARLRLQSGGVPDRLDHDRRQELRHRQLAGHRGHEAPRGLGRVGLHRGELRADSS